MSSEEEGEKQGVIEQQEKGTREWRRRRVGESKRGEKSSKGRKDNDNEGDDGDGDWW